MMHGQDWRGEDIAGWYATEKLDGCRARWDGARLWSRGGYSVKVPAELLATLPAGVALDGELYAGPGTLRHQVAAAMRIGHWPFAVRFFAFDAPAAPGGFAERIAAARAAWRDTVETIALRDADHALALMRSICARGGEGLMAHRPGQTYYAGRTPDLLKLTAKAAAMWEMRLRMKTTKGCKAIMQPLS